MIVYEYLPFCVICLYDDCKYIGRCIIILGACLVVYNSLLMMMGEEPELVTHYLTNADLLNHAEST